MSAHYNELIVLFSSNKRFIAILVIYLTALSVVGFQVTRALFKSQASANNNTFTAAVEFPLTPPETTITTTPTITPTPTPANIATHLVISEVQVGNTAADDEFIELYNPTPSSIDLSTFSLKIHIINSAGTDNNKTLTFTNTIIPAHGFFLIGPSAGYTGATPLDATYSATSGNKLVANGAAYLSTSTSTDKTGLIDLIGYGTSAIDDREGTTIANPTAGSSTERKALSTSTASSMTGAGSDIVKGNGYDTNNNSSDFILRPTSQPQNSSSPVETP